MSRMEMREINYWINKAGRKNYAGPTKGAIVLKDGWIVLIPDFRDRSDAYRVLSSVAINDVAAEMICAPKGGWSGVASVVGLRGQMFLYSERSENFEVALGNLKTMLANHEEKMKELASPENELKDLLASFDTTYEMSDDHRYWSAGDADRRRITELCGKVSQEVLSSLKTQYSWL